MTELFVFMPAKVIIRLPENYWTSQPAWCSGMHAHNDWPITPQVLELCVTSVKVFSTPKCEREKAANSKAPQIHGSWPCVGILMPQSHHMSRLSTDRCELQGFTQGLMGISFTRPDGNIKWVPLIGWGSGRGLLLQFQHECHSLLEIQRLQEMMGKVNDSQGCMELGVVKGWVLHIKRTDRQKQQLSSWFCQRNQPAQRQLSWL